MIKVHFVLCYCLEASGIGRKQTTVIDGIGFTEAYSVQLQAKLHTGR